MVTECHVTTGKWVWQDKSGVQLTDVIEVQISDILSRQGFISFFTEPHCQRVTCLEEGRLKIL